MNDYLIEQKLRQADGLVLESGADVWLTFVRETAEGGDPVLPLLLEGGLTWQSALMIGANGARIAIVGSYDADLVRASSGWHEVIPYVQSIREPLLQALERIVPIERGGPKIAVNYSENDVKADGLSHGMFRLLGGYLHGTRFEGSLMSAERIVGRLRARKTPDEIARIRAAITETERLFDLVDREVRIGMSERDVYDLIQGEMAERGLGYAWDQAGDPIVNTGPDSAIGHGLPSSEIRIAPGHILHIDLGVTKEGYSSDIQSCWYVPMPGESEPPPDLIRALSAVTGAISAAAEVLKPGVEGWQVDEAARRHVTAAGFPEYMHAVGHQVGRVAHDGGGILGPRWERYGNTPYLPIEADQVYTLELGVFAEGRGYLGIEEMVRITDSGCEWLTGRQLDIPLLGQSGRATE